jgi:prolyl-tRNA editing enzyme YbaK/EbsC (Cys-tRNA(Pro) deacylase)
MHPNVLKVMEALRARGFEAQPVEFPQTTRTSADAAGAVGTTVGQIAKSLVFLAGEEPVMVIASGANRVSTTKLGAILGTKVGRADADVVRRATGFPIGGVPPVGHPLRVLIDEDLLAFDEIWASAGTPNAVFPLPAAQLPAITGGEVADVRE